MMTTPSLGCHNLRGALDKDPVTFRLVQNIDCHLVCLKATSAQMHFSDLTLQTPAVSGSPQHSHTQYCYQHW